MKKLIFGVFAITFLSSFSNTEDVFTCYDDCDEMAWVNGGIFDWTAEQEFAAFADCYDNNCGGNDGQVSFPNGNSQ